MFGWLDKGFTLENNITLKKEKSCSLFCPLKKNSLHKDKRFSATIIPLPRASPFQKKTKTEDGTQSQASGSGQNSDPIRSEDGPPVGFHASGGLGLLGQASSSSGPKAYISTGPSPLGLVCYGNGNGKPKEKVGPLGLLKRDGPAFRSTYPPVSSKAQKEKGSSAMERSPLRGPDVGISNCWGKDDQWGLRRGDET